MMGVNVVCKIAEEDVNKIILIAVLEEDKVLHIQKCEQNCFCERIPTMMANVLFFLKNHNDANYYLDNVKFSTDFDTSKNITTYRIFNSFVFGMDILQARKAQK